MQIFWGYERDFCPKSVELLSVITFLVVESRRCSLFSQLLKTITNNYLLYHTLFACGRVSCTGVRRGRVGSAAEVAAAKCQRHECRHQEQAPGFACGGAAPLTHRIAFGISLVIISPRIPRFDSLRRGCHRSTAIGHITPGAHDGGIGGCGAEVVCRTYIFAHRGCAAPRRRFRNLRVGLRSGAE